MTRAENVRVQQFRAPFPPYGVETSRCLALSQRHRFPKSSKFTDSFVVHGRWENNTLDEATNLRQRERRLKEKSMRKMEQMSDKFCREMKEVQRIQEVVRTRQRRVAQAKLRICCALMIQATWRGHRAKVLARERRGQYLARLLLWAWRRFKTRRSLAIVRRFVLASIRHRVEVSRKRSKATSLVQRAWRRSVLRKKLGRSVAASAAVEVVLEDLFVELVRSVYIESMAKVIAKAWKRRRLRIESKNAKSRCGRVFLTQGGTSSPRRKTRSAGSRTGIASDPSSSPARGALTASLRGTKPRVANTVGNAVAPALLAIVATAAVTSGGTEEQGDRRRRTSSQSSTSNSGTVHDTNRSRRKYPGTLTTPPPSQLDEGGSGQQHELARVPDDEPTPVGPCGRPRDKSTRRPPYATVPSSDSTKSVGSSDCGGGIGNRSGGAGVAEEESWKLSSSNDNTSSMTTASGRIAQPRRPSLEKRSKLSEGPRAHAFTLRERGLMATAHADCDSSTAVLKSVDDIKDIKVAATATAAEVISTTDPLPEADSQRQDRLLPWSEAQSRVGAEKMLEVGGREVNTGSPTKTSEIGEYESDAFESEGDLSMTR